MVGCHNKCKSCELKYDTCTSCSSNLRDISKNCACIDGYYDPTNSLN